MINAFVFAAIAGFVSSPAMACQPPPPGYFEWGNLNAITSSSEVREKMDRLPVTSISLIKGSEYLVVSGVCSLHVTVDAKQKNPSAPCGGPFEFTAVPAMSIACTQ